MDRNRGPIGKRLDTLRAVVWLALARLTVKFLPLSRWQDTLGSVADEQENSRGNERNDTVLGKYWAARVDRAARRLPGEHKCLPQAVALQWLLSQQPVSSCLVIAVHRQTVDDGHGLHAWVESQGEMLIGHCNKADYRSIAIFEQ
ncbi:hypothetical protein BPTFM16_01820 [Altererythrobacter insulae]|nr:hypothetical protein BPTFM16_01820 [Altererythrobacter insulae]